MTVQPAVSERQGGVEGRLGHVAQQSRGDSLINVVGCLPGRQIDGQLVHHRFQGVGCGHGGRVALLAEAMLEFIAAVVDGWRA